MILKEYTSPQAILDADPSTLIPAIAKASRKGIATAAVKYEQLVLAAKESFSFGHALDSNFF